MVHETCLGGEEAESCGGERWRMPGNMKVKTPKFARPSPQKPFKGFPGGRDSNW
jgi:hypothetical protein